MSGNITNATGWSLCWSGLTVNYKGSILGPGDEFHMSFEVETGHRRLSQM